MTQTGPSQVNGESMLSWRTIKRGDMGYLLK